MTSVSEAAVTVLDDETITVTGVAGHRPDQSDDGKRSLRNTFGQFATGVTIITTRTEDGEDVGITANSFTSVSLDPALILWSIALTSQNLDSFWPGSRFAVNVLSDAQEPLARHFARSGKDQFLSLETPTGMVRGLGQTPLLDGSLACFECVTDQLVPAGDHNLIIGRIERYFNGGGLPLAFHCGKFTELQPLR